MLKLSAGLVVLGLALLLASLSPWPAPDSQAAVRGAALFRDKGCALCHLHRQVAGQTGQFSFGPDLSTYTNDPAFLQQWLANPRAVRPNAEMPTLKLSEQEIADLIAFLNAPRP